jgi:ABC-type nitrate/sulfonate/bicarbonate transport system substrate-binding protein
MNIKATQGWLNVLIIVGALALLFVVGYPQYKESQPSKVRFGVDESYASVPFYVAYRDTTRRYFAIEKIEPEFVKITGDPLQGLKDGLYDVAAVPWYWLIISPALNGDTLKAFGAVEFKSGKALDGIVVPEKSRITILRDLRRKRLGYRVQDEYIMNLLLKRIEQETGITDIEKVSLQPDEIYTAFEDKKVDALYLIDPYRGYMVYIGNRSMYEGLISSYIVPSMPYAAFVMRKKYVKEEQRLAAIRVKNAVDAALSYLTRNPDIVKNYMVNIHDWPSDGALTLNIRTPEYQRLSEINLKDVENLQTTLVQMGIGTCGIKPNEFLFTKIDFVR